MRIARTMTRGALLALVAGCAVGCATAPESTQRKTLADTDVAPAGAAVEADALAIVARAATLIRSADHLSVEAISGFDVVQDTGQKIEFGSTWEATIQRPNRARLASRRRDGVRTQIVLDGNDVWMYSPDHEVYAHEPQPGDIDASFNFLLEELDVSTPLHNLFSSDLGADLQQNLASCFLVGDTTIEGHDCHHIAAQNDYVDFQLWIDRGDVPALRRIVVSYREEEGHPQYWAWFKKWDFVTKPVSRTFVFQPPAGAERIRMAHAREGEE